MARFDGLKGMFMDSATLEMVLTAYDETAHAEGLTAAAMLPAAVTGVEDSAARAEVEALDPRKRLAA
jgi:hypothetical protein